MRVYLRTFGCRANQYDGEAVRALLRAAGHEVVDSVADADAAVFNSCAVTAEAEADLRQAVRKSARQRPGLQSVVMGCASALPAAQAPDSPLRALPGVTALVPGADLPAVLGALGVPMPAVSATTPQSGTRGLLRVQDGCDEHCTFCATTVARGAHRSRTADVLSAEAQALAESHPEIVITGIHIGGWGKEWGLGLGSLLERLVRDVPAVRFRLTSVEATEVDDRLVELMAGAPDRLAPHLHAPLQSGSDRVLRRMGRHWYTSTSYAAAVDRVRAAVPGLALGADVIAGFPGETPADHAATVALAEALPFTSLHVFPYSPRPGTAATRLGDPVPPDVARARARELREIGARRAAEHRTRRSGGAADVVVLEAGLDGSRRGLTEDYLSVLLAEPRTPRGVRFPAELRLRGADLVAHPRPSSEPHA